MLKHMNAVLRDRFVRVPVTVPAPLSVAANLLPFVRAAVWPPEEAMLALDGNGFIRDCSAGALQMLEYRRADLIGRHASLVLPDVGAGALNEGEHVYSRLAYLSRGRRSITANRRDGKGLSCALFLGDLEDTLLAVIIRVVVGPASHR